MLTATRYHDISVGHRVLGHSPKCEHLHGHNYRIHFTLETANTESDVVLDFDIIKKLFCVWLEENWDHKFLISHLDPWWKTLNTIDPDGLCVVGFNPTAENMAKFLCTTVAPLLLNNVPRVQMKRVVVEETRKCSATFEV